MHFPIFKCMFSKILEFKCKKWYDKGGEEYTKVEEKRLSNMTNMKVCYDVKDIAKYIIAYCNKNNKSITNLVIQKTLYYVQGYFIKKFNELAFDAEIVKWPYGPVAPEAYFSLCAHRNYPIQLRDEEFDCCINLISDSDDKKLINEITDKCINCGVTKLVNKTHSEDPWNSTSMKSEIEIEKIIKFFKNNDPWELGEEIDG